VLINARKGALPGVVIERGTLMLNSLARLEKNRG
jgi:hypothetical protein